LRSGERHHAQSARGGEVHRSRVAADERRSGTRRGREHRRELAQAALADAVSDRRGFSERAPALLADVDLGGAREHEHARRSFGERARELDATFERPRAHVAG
jgi:hypothetical protein